MVWVKYIVIAILLSSVVLASPYNDMRTLAKIIDNGNETETSMDIDSVVDILVKYEYSYRPKGVYRAWQDRLGDCTDRAMVKRFMWESLGGKAKLVHGYDYMGLKHDWIQYKIGGIWLDYEYYSTQTGYGIW